MRLGVIASAGGSAFEAAVRILRGSGLNPEISVVTDRPCGAECRAEALEVPCRRIAESDNRAFSEAAREHLEGVDAVLLFFTRLVTAELFGALSCFNIHPSLLPAFAGFRAVEHAARRGVRFFGATLHLATVDPDAGPIVAQTSQPIGGESAEALHRYAFVHKVALSVLLVELLAEGALVVDQKAPIATVSPAWPVHDRINPAIRSPALWSGLTRLQRAEGLDLFQPRGARP